MTTAITSIWLSPNRVERVFEGFDKKITFLSERLEQADSNKNFYRNTRMRAIAVSIGIIATAILATYLSFTIGLPALVSWAISPAFTPGIATGLSIGTFALTVLGGYALKYYLNYLEFRFSDITASQKNDQCSLQLYSDVNRAVSLLFAEKWNLYLVATNEQYTDNAFTCMRLLDPTIPDLGEEDRQSYWDANKERFRKIRDKFDEFRGTSLYKEVLELASQQSDFLYSLFSDQ